MVGEFEKQIRNTSIGEDAKEKLLRVIGEAGREFPCLSCPSKDECNNFKWFIKWFEK